MRANELLLWLSARREGSWQQFRQAVEALHSSDVDANSENDDEFPLHQQLRIDLERLAHVEFFATNCSVRCRTASPTARMNNPLALFRNLRDLYLRYLDSPFDLRYADLVRERRTLLDRDGYLWRQPLIEPVPAYPPCGRNFRGVAHDLLNGPWGAHAADELADFMACGAFRADLQPYEHQRRAFEQSVVHGRDVVVTTGTGSGKTECFLLPVLAAPMQESTTWDSPNPRSLQWDWWNDRHKYFQGKNIRYAQRVPQRAHEDPTGRPAAIRALLLYPLNALVEDQLIRLREALDSTAAREWLDEHRGGNRF